MANCAAAMANGIEETDAVCPRLSVTVIVTGVTATLEGVPVNSPVGLRVSPGGTVPLHLKGATPPVALRVKSYLAPAKPSGRALLVMANGAGERME